MHPHVVIRNVLLGQEGNPVEVSSDYEDETCPIDDCTETNGDTRVPSDCEDEMCPISKDIKISSDHEDETCSIDDFNETYEDIKISSDHEEETCSIDDFNETSEDVDVLSSHENQIMEAQRGFTEDDWFARVDEFIGGNSTEADFGSNEDTGPDWQRKMDEVMTALGKYSVLTPEQELTVHKLERRQKEQKLQQQLSLASPVLKRDVEKPLQAWHDEKQIPQGLYPRCNLQRQQRQVQQQNCQQISLWQQEQLRLREKQPWQRKRRHQDLHPTGHKHHRVCDNHDNHQQQDNQLEYHSMGNEDDDMYGHCRCQKGRRRLYSNPHTEGRKYPKNLRAIEKLPVHKRLGKVSEKLPVHMRLGKVNEKLSVHMRLGKANLDMKHDSMAHDTENM